MLSQLAAQSRTQATANPQAGCKPGLCFQEGSGSGASKALVNSHDPERRSSSDASNGFSSNILGSAPAQACSYPDVSCARTQISDLRQSRKCLQNHMPPKVAGSWMNAPISSLLVDLAMDHKRSASQQFHSETGSSKSAVSVCRHIGLSWLWLFAIHKGRSPLKIISDPISLVLSFGASLGHHVLLAQPLAKLNRMNVLVLVQKLRILRLAHCDRF